MALNFPVKILPNQPLWEDGIDSLVGISPDREVKKASPFFLIEEQPSGDGSSITFQNSSTSAIDIYHENIVPDGYEYWGQVRSVLDITDSGVTHASAFDGYVINRVPMGEAGAEENNAVGLFLLGLSAADNARTWAINWGLVDDDVYTGDVHTGRQLIGIEGDFQVNGASEVAGGGLIIQGPGTPSGANGWAVHANTGSTARWDLSFWSSNGASGSAFLAGAMEQGGASISSQPIRFVWFDLGEVWRENWIQVNGSGQFELTSNLFSTDLLIIPQNGFVEIVPKAAGNANMVIYGAGTGNLILSPNNEALITSAGAIQAKGYFTKAGSSDAGNNGNLFNIDYANNRANIYMDTSLLGQMMVAQSSATPVANGDLAVETTSNTALTFKFKGSDGVVRTASVALA